MNTFYAQPPDKWVRHRLKFLMEGSQNGAWGSEAGEDAENVICVRVADFRWDRLAVSLEKRTVRSFPQAQIKKLALRRGDLLLEKSGGGEKTPVGRVVGYQHDDLAVTSNFVARIRPSRQVNSQFLLYLIAAQYISGYSYQFIKQNTGIQNLDDGAWFAGDVWLPDFPTQTAIAHFLDRETARIDRLIEKKQRLVEVLGEKERSHIAQMFSALDARIWRVRHLGKLKNGAGFPVELQGDPSQDIAFFKVKHLKTHGLDAAIRDTEDTVSKKTARSLRATVFPEGTIVFAKIGAALLLGRFSMLGRPACIDNNMAAFIPNEKLIDPHYALLGLSQADMTTMVQPGAVPSMSTEAFYSFSIALPSRQAQSEFVEVFRAWRSMIGKVIDKTEQSIDALREFRAALITAAVTGQIDVTSWGKRGETDRRLDKIEEDMAAPRAAGQVEARA